METTPNLSKEKAHHDKWAKETDIDNISIRKSFEGATAPENRFIYNKILPIKGKRILDLGCGLGESSVYFALQGASCVAVDCSPGMVASTRKLAKRYGVDIETHVMDVQELKFSKDSFDVVYAANLLHHVKTMETLRGMHRMVKPGGVVCFWDPLKHNPIINVYRRIATRVRTEDESPLDIKIVKKVRSLFTKVEYDTFWFATLWLFLRFFFIERVDPNEERYWKKILQEEERLRSSYLRLERIDRYLKHIPHINRFAWNIVVVATK